MLGGNYVIASHHPKPWRKQLNLMLAYAYFYNPLRVLAALLRPNPGRVRLKLAALQVLGMWGLSQTLRRTFGWALRLMTGRIKREGRPPASRMPMRSPKGEPADHAIPGTALPEAKAAPVPAPTA